MREEMNPDGGAVSLGSPTRRLVLQAPAYDLGSRQVTSSLAPEDVLFDTESYAMRLLVDGRPVDGTVAVSFDKGGNVDLDSFGGAFTLLPGVSGDLGRYTYVEVTGYGVYAWDAETGALTPLDEPAARTLDGTSISLELFATALGKRYAERAAVARAEGPTAGGGGTELFGAAGTLAEEAWQAKVTEGLAVPDDLVWSEEKGTYAEQLAAREAESAPVAAEATDRGDGESESGANPAGAPSTDQVAPATGPGPQTLVALVGGAALLALLVGGSRAASARLRTAAPEPVKSATPRHALVS